VRQRAIFESCVVSGAASLIQNVISIATAWRMT
jgi:hypothetical protein